MTLIALWIFVASTGVVAQPDCADFRVEVPVDRVVASAATVPNLLGRRQSVHAETERMLAETGHRAEIAPPPRGLCPDSCIVPDRPEVVFRSNPSHVLTEYDGFEQCERLLDSTSRQPLAFQARRFASVDELTDWVGDFTRGRGEDGQQLYRQCDGQCSPSYKWIISRSGAGFIVDAEVTCGHARDRHENLYDLSTSLRWTCRPRDVSP